MAAQNTYGARYTYSNKAQDRTVPNYAGPSNFTSVQFGQSAPAHPRAQQSGPSQQSITHYPPQYASGPPPLPPGRQTLSKEPDVMENLSQEQREEIGEAFNMFDLNRDTFLDYHEFRVALQALGFKPPKAELLQIMEDAGEPRQGAQRLNPIGRGQTKFHVSQLQLSWEAFNRIAAQMMFQRDPLEEVDRAYYLFDAEKKGRIDFDDLRRVTQELGESLLDEQELNMMIEEFDYEGIGGISKETFRQICLQ